MWQDRSREFVKREELRRESEHAAEDAEEHARELDADEAAARAERKRLERGAAEHGHDQGDVLHR